MKPSTGFWLGLFVLLLYIHVYTNIDYYKALDTTDYIMIGFVLTIIGSIGVVFTTEIMTYDEFKNSELIILLVLCPVWFIILMMFRGVVSFNNLLNSLEKKKTD